MPSLVITAFSEGPTMKLLATITVLATVALVGCETSGSAAGVGGTYPPMAVEACTSGADDLQVAAPGTSVLLGVVILRDLRKK